MLSTPKFNSGAAQVSWREERPGELIYSIRGRQDRAVEINAGMLVIALLADGRRNLGEIYSAVLSNDIGIDDPAFVVLTLQQLEVIGAVTMAWHFETTGDIRYECVACGQSCEGHLIGPLSAGEVERLNKFKEELKTLEPDLPDEDPVVFVSDDDDNPNPVLNTTPGQCVFLDANRLCAIHRHFGSRAKPLRCQLFPYRVIQTEAGFRVGVASRCAMAHRSFQTAAPTTPEELMQGMHLRRPPGAIVGLDPTASRSLRPTPPFQAGQGQERFFMSLLANDEVTLGEIIASADGTHRPSATPPANYLADVCRRLRRFGETYEPDPLNRPEAQYGAGVRSLLRDLTELPDEVTWREPENPARAYLLHSLRQFIFVREALPFGGVAIGAQITLMGILGVLLTSSPWNDGDLTSDLVGNRLAYWLRINNGGRAVSYLFDDGDDFASTMDLLSEDA